LPAGPFAILPLKGRRSSIVWTEESAEAQRIVALSDDEFHAALEQRFKLELGEIKVIGPRRVHPLGFFVARSFIAERIALIGDAAHVIHPIAGQGLNMGLKDVAALAEVIVDAARLGIDHGLPSVLERYQRWRRFDTMTMGLATDGLNRLFSNRSDVLRLARDVGLGLVDRLPALKRLFIREAAGLVGDVPKLLRGEPL
jgi:2-octaprenyl-6-methoxyphenol hydroxylase